MLKPDYPPHSRKDARRIDDSPDGGYSGVMSISSEGETGGGSSGIRLSRQEYLSKGPGEGMPAGFLDTAVVDNPEALEVVEAYKEEGNRIWSEVEETYQKLISARESGVLPPEVTRSESFKNLETSIELLDDSRDRRIPGDGYSNYYEIVSAARSLQELQRHLPASVQATEKELSSDNQEKVAVNKTDEEQEAILRIVDRNRERRERARKPGKTDVPNAVEIADEPEVLTPSSSAPQVLPDSFIANRQPETAQEHKDALREQIEEVQRRLSMKKESGQAFDAAEERRQGWVNSAKEAYFEKLVAYQKSRSMGDALSERMGIKRGRVDEGDQVLKDLKAGWLSERAELARMRLDEVEARLAGRGVQDRSPVINQKTGKIIELEREGFGKNGTIASLRKDRDIYAIKERYERRFIAKDVLYGAVHEEQEVRMQALRERDRNVIEGAWKRYQSLPPEAKLLLSGTGLAFTAGAAVAGSAATILPFIALGTVGLGMRAAAMYASKRTEAFRKRIEARKGEKENIQRQMREAVLDRDDARIERLKIELENFAAGEQTLKRLEADAEKSQKRSAFFSLTGAASWLAGKGVEILHSKKREESEQLSGKLAKDSNYQARNLSVEGSLGAQSLVAAKAQRTLQQQRAQATIAKTAGGIAGAYGAGSIIGDATEALGDRLMSGDTPSAEQTAGAETGPDAEPPANKPDEAPAAEGGEAPANDAPEQVADEVEALTEPNGELRAFTVEANSGVGFNGMFANLDTSGIESPSSVVEALRSMSASELSENIGVLDGAESGVTQGGDQFVLDNDQRLWFVRDGEAQLVMESDGNGGVTYHELEGIEMRPHVVPVEVRQESGAAPEVAATAEESAPPVEEEAESPAATESLSEPVFVPAETLPTEPVAEEVPAAAEAVAGRSEPTFVSDYIQGAELERPQAADSTETASADIGSGRSGMTVAEYAAGADVDGSALSEAASEAFINARGVEVNLAEPATYVWQIPGTENTITVAQGGSFEEQNEWARTYANEHPGATVHFVTPVRDITGVLTYRLDAWDSVAGVPAERLEGILPDPEVFRNMRTFPPIDANDLVRRMP